MPSAAASTRSWCSTATATSCARGAKAQYPRAHGVHMGPDDSIYLTDDGGHFVRKCSLDGKLLLEIGVPGKPAAYMSGEPFHRCTHTALSPKGEIYVSDGYGNAKVHKYSPDGKLLMSWGEPGTGPGEFNIVHNICTDADGWVYVADRENHRVQVFDGNGKYETQWNNLHRPCGLYMDYTRHPVCYIGELGPSMAVNLKSPNLGPRVSIVDHQGKLLSRFGDPHASLGPTGFIGPHGMCADFARRSLRRRSLLDFVAGGLSGRTAAGQYSLLPQVREGSLMSEVSVSVNGRSFKIACEDGQEPRIRRLAQYVDAKVGEFVANVGQVGEARLLLLAALVIADELSDANDALERAGSNAAASGVQGMSKRIEPIAARLDTP